MPTTLVPRALDLIRPRSPDGAALLSSLCQISAQRDERLFLVGGLVRDILLDRAVAFPRSLDIDLAIDAETGPYCAVIEAAAGNAIVRHDRFDTASAELGDGTRVDLARTRSERYSSAGSLPEVQPSPIEIDLQRRDFSINAAAIALSGPDAGRLLDPLGAQADVRSRRIRALHSDSFRDDPTRLIRAARYAARIGGAIERSTLADARRDRNWLSVLSAGRFGDAWRLLLEDSAAHGALQIARQLKIPQSREPRWSVTSRAVASVKSVKSVKTARHFWSAVGLTSSDPGIEEWLPPSVAMRRPEKEALAAGVRMRGLRRSIGRTRRASRVAALVENTPIETVETAARLWSGASSEAVRGFLDRRGTVRSPVSAERLVELGVERGPALGEWLRRIEAMVWDCELDPGAPVSVALIEERIRLSR